MVGVDFAPRKYTSKIKEQALRNDIKFLTKSMVNQENETNLRSTSILKREGVAFYQEKNQINLDRVRKLKKKSYFMKMVVLVIALRELFLPN